MDEFIRASRESESIAASQHRSITTFVIDACPIFVQGLALSLDQGEYVLCGQADSVDAIDESIAPCNGDMVLCFVGPNLRTRDAFAACRRIHALCALPRIVFITNVDYVNNAKFREDVADAGALACLPVTVTKEALLDLLPMVLTGSSLIALDPDAQRVRTLSEREMEVLRLIEAGMSNVQIAEALHLGKKTVDKHVQHIFEKLCVSCRQDAVHRARHRGLL